MIKKIFASSMAFILMLTLSLQAQESVKTDIDIENSSVNWVGKKVTGAHEGTIDIAEGFLLMNKGIIAGGEFSLDMTSIKVTDIEDEKMNAKLEGHLKNDDFFAVDKHPTSTLMITAVAKKETTDEIASKKIAMVDVYEITADVTIKGITKEIKFDATIEHFSDGSKNAVAQIIIDRTLFDIHYGADKSLGDRMIYKKFILNVDLAL